MKKLNKIKKKLFGILILFGILNSFVNTTFGQENFEIIDKAEDPALVEANVKAVGEQGGSVWDVYDKKAQEMDSEEKLGDQLASGIMTRNTLLRYVVKLVRWLSQAGLLVGALMIVYAGYMYTSEVFSGTSGKGNTAIKNAIIGVIVISFSYAIMKIVTSAFL